MYKKRRIMYQQEQDALRSFVFTTAKSMLSHINVGTRCMLWVSFGCHVSLFVYVVGLFWVSCVFFCVCCGSLLSVMCLFLCMLWVSTWVQDRQYTKRDIYHNQRDLCQNTKNPKTQKRTQSFLVYCMTLFVYQYTSICQKLVCIEYLSFGAS